MKKVSMRRASAGNVIMPRCNMCNSLDVPGGCFPMFEMVVIKYFRIMRVVRYSYVNILFPKERKMIIRLLCGGNS